MVTVVNKHKEPYDIYIGRGSKWGNPFVIGQDGNRNDVIAKYRYHLLHQIATGEVTGSELMELDGKVLGCFCKPQRCHGDVIVEMVNELKDEVESY